MPGTARCRVTCVITRTFLLQTHAGLLRTQRKERLLFILWGLQEHTEMRLASLCVCVCVCVCVPATAQKYEMRISMLRNGSAERSLYPTLRHHQIPPEAYPPYANEHKCIQEVKNLQLHLLVPSPHCLTTRSISVRASKQAVVGWQCLYRNAPNGQSGIGSQVRGTNVSGERE
jgi:hypothetical protein